eukprot:m.198383 g.198383  ORF g.198383 m.198383 type:complete len:524 (+) comp14921_c3_seq2:451-2022(+)
MLLLASIVTALASVAMLPTFMFITSRLQHATIGSAAPAFTECLTATFHYYQTVAHMALGLSYDTCTYFGSNISAKVLAASMGLVLQMWNQPHYRSGTFQQDMAKNLRNVALPGTGIPLSLLCRFRVTYVMYLVLHPFILMAYTVARATRVSLTNKPTSSSKATTPKKTSEECSATECYMMLLTQPKEWFPYWRLNCRLASFHAMVLDLRRQQTEAGCGPANNDGTPIGVEGKGSEQGQLADGDKEEKELLPHPPNGYAMEDKFTFLQEADAAGVPVSKTLTIPGLVIKDRNEEGGMGIHFFKNALNGGRWIIQQPLSNRDDIASLLPSPCPLSTMRIITASDGAVDVVEGTLPTDMDERRRKVKCLSAVFRAGRVNASTDHSSILFDVDLATGTIGEGTTNAHWYQLGPGSHVMRLQASPSFSAHPDTGKEVSGFAFKDIDDMKALVRDAHARLLPDVPLCGWDVAMTKEQGLCLLEVNLSCNFFNGSFDKNAYFKYQDQLFSLLDNSYRSMKHTAVSPQASR